MTLQPVALSRVRPEAGNAYNAVLLKWLVWPARLKEKLVCCGRVDNIAQILQIYTAYHSGMHRESYDDRQSHCGHGPFHIRYIFTR